MTEFRPAALRVASNFCRGADCTATYAGKEATRHLNIRGRTRTSIGLREGRREGECVCVCARETEREGGSEREGGREGERERDREKGGRRGEKKAERTCERLVARCQLMRERLSRNKTCHTDTDTHTHT